MVRLAFRAFHLLTSSAPMAGPFYVLSAIMGKSSSVPNIPKVKAPSLRTVYWHSLSASWLVQ